jgi:hypothetical protein
MVTERDDGGFADVVAKPELATATENRDDGGFADLRKAGGCDGDRKAR